MSRDHLYTSDLDQSVTTGFIMDSVCAISELVHALRENCQHIIERGLYEDAGTARLMLLGLEGITAEVNRLAPCVDDIRACQDAEKREAA
jgi:hypothetical protein